MSANEYLKDVSRFVPLAAGQRQRTSNLGDMSQMSPNIRHELEAAIAGEKQQNPDVNCQRGSCRWTEP